VKTYVELCEKVGAFSDERLVDTWKSLVWCIREGLHTWIDSFPDGENMTYDDWGEILYGEISLRGLEALPV
jgi:hypothetical protein